MGAITVFGSASRIVGPLLVSYVYNPTGMYSTVSILLGSMLLSLTLSLVYYKRLVPFSVYVKRTVAAGDKRNEDEEEVKSEE